MRELPLPICLETGCLLDIGREKAAHRLGLHRRRLLRLIGALEAHFFSDEAAGLVVRDHYVARLLSLFELLAGAYQVAKPG